MRYRNIIQLEASGRYALFTDPLTRSGGEKCSYPVPTYEALKGMLSSIYWLPDITWIVDSVRIMEPIRTESRSVVTRGYFKQGCDLSVYTYLTNVRYRIKAHFVPRNGQELTPAAEHRHFRVALRMLERGGRRAVYLGTKDCPCDISPCVFSSDIGHYDNITADLGMMFHSFSYSNGDLPSAAHYFRCRMENGIILFPQPHECDITQVCRESHSALV